jgi:hypothetical protein
MFYNTDRPASGPFYTLSLKKETLSFPVSLLSLISIFSWKVSLSLEFMSVCSFSLCGTYVYWFLCASMCVFLCVTASVYICFFFFFFAGFWLICVRFLMVWPFQLVTNFFFKKKKNYVGLISVLILFIFKGYNLDQLILCPFFSSFPLIFFLLELFMKLYLMCREVEFFFYYFLVYVYDL